jgi:hypothetical protein
MEDKKEVLSHLLAQQDSMMSLLKDLVLMETPSTDAAAQAPILQRLKLEFDTRRQNTATSNNRRS